MGAWRGQVVTGVGSLGLTCLLLIACSNSKTSPILTPIENTYGFSHDAFETLSSLEKVDDYPLYVMHYVGGYDSPVTVDLPDNTPFACSLFAALGDENQLLYGRNLDWAYAPALLLYTDPPDGYSSVSMVNLSYFNISPGTLKTLMELPISEREGLLGAPFFPFDGMNEYGLTIGIAAVNESVADYDFSRPTIGSLVILREVLDHARTVDETVAIFSQYNIDFTGGPPVHYLIADRNGQAVLIEYIAGQMIILFNEHTWHLATNHLLGIGTQGVGSSGWRYGIMEERLASSDGTLTPEDGMDLLSNVSARMDGTQWSIIYGISTGRISVALARNYDNIHIFQLEILSP